MIHFDEDTEPWSRFIKNLAAYLKRQKIKHVTVGGVWFDPLNNHGCVNHTANSLLYRGFDVDVEHSACGIDQGY